MMTLYKRIVNISFLFLFVFVGCSAWSITYAQQAATSFKKPLTRFFPLSDDVLLPSNNLYFLKEWQRQLVHVLTIDPEKESRLYLENAQSRLQELELILVQNQEYDTVVVENLLTRLREDIDSAQRYAELISNIERRNHTLLEVLTTGLRYQNIFAIWDNEVSDETIFLFADYSSLFYEEIYTQLETSRSYIDATVLNDIISTVFLDTPKWQAYLRFDEMLYLASSDEKDFEALHILVEAFLAEELRATLDISSDITFFGNPTLQFALLQRVAHEPDSIPFEELREILTTKIIGQLESQRLRAHKDALFHWIERDPLPGLRMLVALRHRVYGDIFNDIDEYLRVYMENYLSQSDVVFL